MSAAITRFVGRHRSHLVFAVRGMAAALAALGVAIFLKLENPYWAAMTALIVIQPTRGLLLEKSYYRLVGTVVGAAAGLLLLLSTSSPMVLTIALSLWVAACVGVGNLLYGLRSYAFLMAACTCVVVAMSGYQNPPHLVGIAFGRIACIVVGIIVSTAVTALFIPRHSGDEFEDRLRRVAADSVAWLALLLRQGPGRTLVRHEQDILMEIAEIEGLLDVVGAGSLRLKKRRRHAQNLVASLLSLLAVGRMASEGLVRRDAGEQGQSYWRDRLARHLEEVACKLESAVVVNCTAEMTAAAAEARTRFPMMGESLSEIVASLRPVLSGYGTLADATDPRPSAQFIHHRDWREARRAALRAFGTIGAVGVIWSLTGWTKGPLMLMAISIMISIFSTKEHPANFVGQIFCGAAIGSAAAVLCRISFLSGTTEPLAMAATIAPFIFLGVLAMSYRRTAIGATDATLFFIFVAQPGVPISVLPVDLALGAVAMVMGVGSAWIAYRYLVPINPAIRLRSLLAAIVGDLERLAAADSPAAKERLQARMHHRVIRMVSMATRYDADHLAAVEGGLAALAMGKCIVQLQQPPNGIGEALRSLADAVRRKEPIATALADVSTVFYAALGQGVAADAHADGRSGDADCQGYWEDRGAQCPV
ncbi:FUSC family protein [Geobacter benzoatilyticus]|uniref:FUSC family protein n=1 Tax=Geobacter benzoatilyticus TaxID=2815309 RepID=A0ABX7Q867_9BACT|nr:FUSC family protein [Geobacter benzoatilyticus]QSV47088.1 FUSC family protein [Geobacter benzoatilyticus]